MLALGTLIDSQSNPTELCLCPLNVLLSRPTVLRDLPQMEDE